MGYSPQNDSLWPVSLNWWWVTRTWPSAIVSMQWTATTKRVSRTPLFTTTPHLRLFNASTGVASVCMRSVSEIVPVIEFHASKDAWRHPGTASIHRCLLRIKGDGPGLNRKGLKPPFSDILACFTYLETVVVETGRGFWTGDVQSVIVALHKGSGVEVQHRTSDEALKLALQAKKSPSRSTSAGPLSPLWCLQRSTELWDKL